MTFKTRSLKIQKHVEPHSNNETIFRHIPGKDYASQCRKGQRDRHSGPYTTEGGPRSTSFAEGKLAKVKHRSVRTSEAGIDLSEARCLHKLSTGSVLRCTNTEVLFGKTGSNI